MGYSVAGAPTPTKRASAAVMGGCDRNRPMGCVMAAPGGHASKSPAYTNTTNEIEASRQRIYWALQGASASVMWASASLLGASAALMRGCVIAEPCAHALRSPAYTNTANEIEASRQRIYWALQGASAPLVGGSAAVMRGCVMAEPCAHA